MATDDKIKLKNYKMILTEKKKIVTYDFYFARHLQAVAVRNPLLVFQQYKVEPSEIYKYFTQ